jgi:Gpi18-like mannosyltransferase
MRIVLAALALGVGLFFLRVAMGRPSSNAAVLAGFCWALAAWAKPLALAALPLLAVPLLDRRWPLRARMHLAGSELLGFGAVLLPRLLSRVL